MDLMLVLGIDTCDSTASCALCSESGAIAEFSFVTERTHSQVILPLVKQMLSHTGHTLSDVDGFAAISGPGSYTGLRIGIAAVQGICYALDKPCAGVSALEALSFNLCPASHSDPAAAVFMHARQDLYYFAEFCGGERQCEDQIRSADSITEHLASAGKSYICLGDTANIALPENCITASPLYSRRSAASLCFAAMQQGFSDPSQLSPDYLQPTKAEKDLSASKSEQ